VIKAKIAVIGDRDTVAGFRMVGVNEWFTPRSPDETQEKLKEFFRDPHMGLIIITEPLAQQVEDTINQLSGIPIPVIMLIPDRFGSTGAYEAVMKEMVRRAVGIEISI
jgi:V/A-type H+-transporting ATPase subunit F